MPRIQDSGFRASALGSTAVGVLMLWDIYIYIYLYIYKYMYI